MGKRIKDLSLGATEADLVSGNYLAIDGSEGTKKLPANNIIPSTPEQIGNESNLISDSYISIKTADGWVRLPLDSIAKRSELFKLSELVNKNLTIVDRKSNVNLYNEWESGYFVAGVATASQYAWRTKNFYDCTEIDGVVNSVLVHLADSDYKFAIVVYDENGTYSATSQLQAANFNPGTYGEHRKYKIYITRADNQKITFLTDAQANAICYVEKKDVVVEANVFGGEELLDSINDEINGLSDSLDALDSFVKNDLTIMDGKEDVNLYNEWESGYFVSGVPAASKYAWRTKNFYDCTDIDFDTNSVVVHINDVDYKFVLVIYDSDGNYVNTTSTGGTTTDLTPTAFGANRKYKIYLMRVDNQKITSLTDEEANAICHVEKKDIAVPANVAGVDDLLNIVDQKIAAAIGQSDVFPLAVTKIAFIGDSFTMLDVYTQKVVEVLGLASGSYRNYGISGYGIVDFIANNKKPWVSGMADCQVATLWIGTNDFAQEQPLGDFDSSNTSTFTGALRDFLSWWTNTSAFDNQLKLIITPTQRWGFNSDPIPNPTMTNGLGITLSQYAERLKDVAHDYGIAVLDMYNESGISALALDDGKAKFTTDGLHPTTSYFNRLGIRIAKAIKNSCS